jgi:hypothetical protein
MGINMSKDKQIIRDAVKRFKHDLEVLHQKYMLGVGEERELYHRRIDYAQGLKVFYERLEKEITYETLVRFELHKEPFGLTLVITKGYVKVKQFINYSPYYISGNNRDKTPVSEQMEMPHCLRRYAQYC